MNVDILINKHLGFINEASISVPDKIFVELQKRFVDFLKASEIRAKYILNDIDRIVSKSKWSVKEYEMFLNGSELGLIVTFLGDIFEDKEITSKLENMLDRKNIKYLLNKRGGSGIIIYLSQDLLGEYEAKRHVFSKNSSVKWV